LGGRIGVAVLGLLLLGVACTQSAPPNILLVTFDTTRYDRFGCTGDLEARTPTVDRLAQRGLLFERAYASVGLTLPSHTTILTGLEPMTHGVHNNGRFRVPEEVDTLAERLQATGYDTAAFVSAFVLDTRYRLDQGFDLYSDETKRDSDPLNFSVPQRSGEEVTNEALTWLEKRSTERPFFLWAHYYDPHQPRDVKPPFDTMRDPYAAEIAYADAQLARLLEGVELAAGERETLILFTADHGEGLAEHGEQTHGILAYDSTLHVPLLLVGPGVPRGARARAFARHADIVPTMLESVGLRVPESLPGRSLLDVARREGAEEATSVGYFESRGPHYDHGWAEIEGIRTARWKYTARPEPAELYDIRVDPREMQNRIDAEPDVRAGMESLWVRFREQSAPKWRQAGPVALRPDEMERLAALGYVEAAGTYGPGEEPDPRRLAAVFSWVDQARGMASNGRYDRAIEILETLSESASVRPLVLRSLAPVYAQRGMIGEAVATYRRYIELTGAEEARLGLARVLLDAERPEEALTALDELASPSPQGQVLRAHALGRLGRHAEARQVVDRLFSGRPDAVSRLRQRAALVIDAAPISDGEAELRGLLGSAPDDAKLRSQLGYYLATWGRPEQAEEALGLLEGAAKVAPDDADLLANLGWGAYRLGRTPQAISALERALERDEGRHLERVRLALALRKSGEPERARGLLRSALHARPGAPWAGEAREALDTLEGELDGPGEFEPLKEPS
jgi:arylsulfatase A-like enzyme/Flp pilus assembly protein TadD